MSISNINFLLPSYVTVNLHSVNMLHNVSPVLVFVKRSIFFYIYWEEVITGRN